MENLEIMKGVIFRNDWHLLTGLQIVDLFDKNYDDVTIQPNIDIVKRLKLLEVATLEILENRSCSTVYRIKQYDEVFQIFQPNGDTFFYDTDDYYVEKPIDDLIKDYAKKEPVFVAEMQLNGDTVILYTKEPRFKITFKKGANSSEDVVFLNKPPTDFSIMPNLLRKAGAFYASYLRK